MFVGCIFDGNIKLSDGLGAYPVSGEEEELIYGSKEMGDIFKKKRFVHPDIRPYDELKESSKAYDRCITAGIPLVVNNNT